MTGPVEPPVNYPGLLHFRCGHGIAVAGDAVGPSAWMVITDTDRTQLGVSMAPDDAVTIAAALTDSAARATGNDGRVKLIGGVVELTIRSAIDRVGTAKSMLTADQTSREGGLGYGLDLLDAQLRWLLGERV